MTNKLRATLLEYCCIHTVVTRNMLLYQSKYTSFEGHLTCNIFYGVCLYEVLKILTGSIESWLEDDEAQVRSVGFLQSWCQQPLYVWTLATNWQIYSVSLRVDQSMSTSL